MAKVIDMIVNEFIHRRFPKDSNWTDGNCYYFALILKDRFGGKILYDTINGHFVTEICGIKYDWNGTYDKKSIFWEWDDFEDTEQKQRIRRDCLS